MIPEAKQAAEKEINSHQARIGHQLYGNKEKPLGFFVQQAIDAATDKLDAEWVERIEKLGVIHSKFCEEEKTKLREENKKLNGWLETETMNREEFAKLREELVATQNEVIRLNGLLRVANTEKRYQQLAALGTKISTTNERKQ